MNIKVVTLFPSVQQKVIHRVILYVFHGFVSRKLEFLLGNSIHPTEHNFLFNNVHFFSQKYTSFF